MGCTSSKKLAKIHNTGFDLMDTDGDHKVSKEEIEIVAQYFHRFSVLQSQTRHTELVATGSVDYLYKVIDKKVGSNLKRKDFTICTEFLVKCYRNFKCKEILSKERKRLYGSSKVNKFLDGLKVLINILSLYFQKK